MVAKEHTEPGEHGDRQQAQDDTLRHASIMA
jgi:hypothetical protein